MDLRHCVCLVLLTRLRLFTVGQVIPCRSTQWQCDDGSCISALWRCDGEGDCLDGTDELDCDGSSACPRGQFSCVDSVKCVNMSARCDGKKQCPTGYDEENCEHILGCLNSEWTCNNNLCITMDLRCNGENDCLDNSDEQNCGLCIESLRCPDGTCLSLEKQCDGTVDCVDGRDEPITCRRSCSINNGGCSHSCVDEPWGALCSCPRGYKLSFDGATCKDVDECALARPLCIHSCVNTLGSYYCQCREGFTLIKGSVCLAKGNITRLVTVQRNTLGLLDVKSRHFEVVQFAVYEPVALAYDLVRALYYWADGHGLIHKTNGRHTWTIYAGQPGIRSLACNWLNGQLYWTNQETRTIYMQVADGKTYTTVSSKNVNPSDLVLLPIESLMFWINAGPGERVTIEKSWMDGSDRSCLAVLTAQAAHGLTADVAARRLYWISDSKKSIETVKVDGSGRYSFRGVFSQGPALSLTVFEQFFYWSDKKGLWQAPEISPNQRRLIWKDPLPLINVFHELQQPQVSSPCAGAPCEICLLAKSNTLGFTCTCPNSKLLLPNGICEYPRIVYGTLRTVNFVEFKGGEATEVQLFTTDEGILSFDIDWSRDWFYWANQTGHVKCTSLTQVKTEKIPTSSPACLLKVDQRSGNLYWVSCDQKSINVISADRRYTQKLYDSRRELEDLYLDWLRGGILWQEKGHIFAMSMMGGKPLALLRLGGGVVGTLAFDLRANSLLWNSNPAGLVTMSLFWDRSHVVGKRWNITGSVVFALEPFLLSFSDNTMTLWDRRDGRSIQSITVQSHVIGVIHALKDLQAGWKDASVSLPYPQSRQMCKSPAVLCPQASVFLCISPSQVCDGIKDCPDGFDENNCVKRCASKNDFLCKDRRSCVSQDLVCDGRAHCIDGSDEMNCPSLATPSAPSNILKCRHGSRPCGDRSECVLFSHVCDGQRDCSDGSDENECENTANALEEDHLSIIEQSQPTAPFIQPPAQPACKSPSVLCPGSSVCLLETQFCDGRKDCPDGSDEKCVTRCPYMTDFLCKDHRSCVSQHLVCDGRAHCLDSSDEKNCLSSTDPTSSPIMHRCRFGSRLCADGSECVLFSHVCDGQRDCADGSDEAECETTRSPDKIKSSTAPFTQPTTQPACKSPSVLCPGSSVCLLETQFCDGRKDCPDGSDEKCVTRCPYMTDFLCKDHRNCVSQHLICDGRAHCLDSSDERNCPNPADPTSPSIMRKCRFGSRLCADSSACVLISHVCDGQRDCTDGSDEEGCDALEMTTRSPEKIQSTEPFAQPPTKPPCRSPSVLCPGSSLCILETQFCDGRKDCPDGSDEKCVKRCPYKDDFLCKDRRNCVSQDLVCDGRAHCLDGSDEMSCPSLASPTDPPNILKCRHGSRPCGDGSECILFSHVCDGQRDCSDGTDEDGCDAKDGDPTSLVKAKFPSMNEVKWSCARPSVLCPESSVCILPTQFCDGKLDCPGGFDENCETRCPDKSDFLCKDFLSCVSKNLVCNGHSDCSDGSDEFNCPNIIPPPPSGDLQCPRGSKPCNDGSECVLLSHLCDGEEDCQDASDELLCPKSCKQGAFQCAHGKMCIPSSQVCDGKIHCLDHSDEINCLKQTKSCEFHCLDGKRCIPKTFLCDGERDCEDGTDEQECVTAAPQSCNSPSLLCPGTSVCVSQSQLCDYKKDCPDGFDEQGCIIQCENPVDYLCQDRNNCIPPIKVCDGHADCFDSSDEKLCTTPYSPVSAISSPIKCRRGFKLCKDGLECVMYNHVCDGEVDCKDGSDEEDCATDCKSEEFQCAHGKRCIPKEQVCDGQSDCQDRSDEMNCRSAGEGCHQWCDNNTRCIPDTFLCDGEKDCADGSDENKCGLVACESNQYRCKSGQCVSQAVRCDGYADCGDHSDEKDCSRPPRCLTQLRCPNSHECLQKEWICDGEKDCADGYDERNCRTAPVKCKEYQWQCGDDSQCIPLSWRCDGKEDCENGKDEDQCSERKCAPHLYTCGSSECLEPRQLCNRVTNCADRSDEGAGCHLRNCSSSLAPRCDHYCVTTPSGPRCFCAAGFQPHRNGLSCVDIDECRVSSGVCKHICLNTQGSYVCHCHPGFYLELDKRSCKTEGEALLLASVQSEMVILGVHSATLRVLSSANRPVFSLDYHWVKNRIYWLSSNYQSIRWAEMNDTNNKGTLMKGVKSEFIAVDWVGKNMYWVDGLLGQILAVKLSDDTVKAQDHTMVLGELEQPSSLVLVSHKGLMFWSEIGSTPQIEQAGMDGSKRKVVVSQGLSWPVSLAFDVLDNRIYWADEKLRCIGSASMDGENVKILQLAETPSPFSVSVFNEQVFWSDTKKRSIRSADKITGKDQKVLVKRPGQPFALKIMHPLSQPSVFNPCEQLPCSHVCLLTPVVRSRSGNSRASKGLSAVCRCPKGLLLSKDNLKCTVPMETTFIMILSLQAIYQIHLHSMYSEGVGLRKIPNGRVLALPGIGEASSMDVSLPGLTLYVADAVLATVNKLKLSDSRSGQSLLADGQILKLSQDDSITALAVDWVTSNLYWSSSKRYNLHVTSPERGHTASLLPGSMKGTTSIAVHPPSGRLCYTAVDLMGNSEAEASCAWMDGRKKTVLWRKSSVPTSLVFSDTGTVIYWADTGEGVIYTMGVDGSGLKQYKTGPGFLISFTFIENFMLWMTFDKDVTRLWFSDGLQPKHLWFETKIGLIELKAYSNKSQSGSNSCAYNNGGCAHLCLPYPGGNTCRCGQGFYTINVTSCALLPSCPSDSQSCPDGSKCISSSRFCDAQEDCQDGSDEQDCPYEDIDLPGMKSNQSSLVKSALTPSDANSQKKLDASCDLQCNGHGSCVGEGTVQRCQCVDGYTGDFCQVAETSHSGRAVGLGLLFVFALLIAAIFIYIKRRDLALALSTTREKETLMNNIGLPSEQLDYDHEELDSPVDGKSPVLTLESLQLKQ
ncbi:low-density lipoprotein receptor-related protein 2-like [Periophthalmus magnuspinnatus]|uniref:low-density lipoprotein receptor-related protein 2-like n=1 Tax=Periophthalmus magnuspinnatus TaxID=409849 RepID=UPI002436DA42|nr:low-density lipoprotein receptor-related protein 2-like [Periophthalmus magnuspinnatus]